MANLPFRIIHEDRDLIVIDKPAGLLTSTTPREKRATAWALLKSYFREHDPKARIGLIHRLDRDASGLLVFSKNDRAYRSLKQQFFDHSVDRVYLAIVRGTPQPPAGRIKSKLVERADGTVHSTRGQHGEMAISDYQVVRVMDDFSLVRMSLQTGRKHQIRVHLSERGCPIVGDPLYGDTSKNGVRLMLAAVELSFDHPRTGKRIELEIRMPDAMRRLLRP